MSNAAIKTACLFGNSSPKPNRPAGVGRFLPTAVSAVEFIRSMRGRTSPSLLRCSDGKYYVVKSQHRCRHPHALANEMLAGRLAIMLGLPVCDPVVVKVPQALSGGVSHGTESTRSSRLDFGSAFPDPPDQMLVTDFLPDRLLRRAISDNDAFLGVFVFDLWTCNTGRRKAIFSRPAGDEGASYSVWLIDHDACFNDGDWKLSETQVPCTYAQRTVYGAARGIDSFEPFLLRIENLEARQIEAAARCVPAQWCPGGSREILNLAEQLFHRRKQVRQATARALQNTAWY
jgi:HipA-like kinase